jgi:hypothetical protein
VPNGTVRSRIDACVCRYVKKTNYEIGKLPSSTLIHMPNKRAILASAHAAPFGVTDADWSGPRVVSVGASALKIWPREGV